MKNTIGLLFALLFAACVVSGQAVAGKDLKMLEGAAWTGSLTYLDYGSGKKTTIKSDLRVVKKSDGVWTFEYTYPDEPKANGNSDVSLSADGKTFNGQSVIAREKDRGTLRIVATKEGEDNKKKALFRYTYLLTKKTFTIRKDVQYVGETEWFERNTYSWTRSN